MRPRPKHEIANARASARRSIRANFAAQFGKSPVAPVVVAGLDGAIVSEGKLQDLKRVPSTRILDRQALIGPEIIESAPLAALKGARYAAKRDSCLGRFYVENHILGEQL